MEVRNFITNLLSGKSRSQRAPPASLVSEMCSAQNNQCVTVACFFLVGWGHILILITGFYVLLFLKLCKQDVMVQPFLFACKPSKMMFNLGFHKSVLKAKQIKKASLLVCLVFFLSLFLVFFFFLQEVNIVITLAE